MSKVSRIQRNDRNDNSHILQVSWNETFVLHCGGQADLIGSDSISGQVDHVFIQILKNPSPNVQSVGSISSMGSGDSSIAATKNHVFANCEQIRIDLLLQDSDPTQTEFNQEGTLKVFEWKDFQQGSENLISMNCTGSLAFSL